MTFVIHANIQIQAETVFNDEHVFWSYNIGAHIEAKQPSVALSSTIEVSFDITHDERTNHCLESKEAAPAKKGSK